MSSELDLEPLGEDVRALIEGVDKLDAQADAAMVERLRARIDLTLAAGVSIDPPVRATPTFKRPPLRRALEFASTFAAGAIVALAVEHALAPKPKAVDAPPSNAVVAAASTATLTAPSPLASPSTDERTATVASSRPVPPSAAAPASSVRPTSLATYRETGDARDGDLAVETRLVDTARAALAHGDFVAALAAATSHEQRFPRGRLAEEREAIMIQALAGAHRDGEATTRAEAFRTRWPTSFFLPLVQRAVTSP